MRYTPSDSHTSMSKNAEGVWDGEQRAIANLDVPIAPQDAATKSYVDDAFAAIAAFWTYQQQTTIADPGAGALRMNDAPEKATAIALSTLTDLGVDVAGKIASALSGDIIEIQSDTVLTRWVRFELTAAPTMHGTWAEVAVTAIKYGEADFANNARVAVRVLSAPRVTRALLLDLMARIG